jgi:hypothetical protein
MSKWLPLVPAVIGLALAGWFYQDIRALRAELSALRGETPPVVAKASDTRRDAKASALRRGGGSGLLAQLGRRTDSERPELPDRPDESRVERRQRRQEELRAILGREPGESDEDYRARVAPFIQTALAVPRARLEEARASAEAAARVSEDQRRNLDALFEDVTRETLDLTNLAISSGDLTPYERNVAGVLSWTGGLGAILGTTQARIGEILRPDQLRTLSQQGFDFAEYVGAQVPWETLNPPPPPPGGGG